MKWWSSAVAASIVLASSSVPVVMASTTSANQNTSIVVNNDTISSPHVLTSGGQAYVPLWYVMQALQTLGIKSSWANETWSITTPEQVTVTPSTTPSTAPAGQALIQVDVNGQALSQIPVVYSTDPASKKVTTYVQVTSLASVMKTLALSVLESNGSWQVQTPDVVALGQAFSNTAMQPSTQVTASLSENITVNLTPAGQMAAGNTPTNQSIQMNILEETGTVNGEKAAYVVITPSTSSASGSSTTSTTPNSSSTNTTTPSTNTGTNSTSTGSTTSGTTTSGTTTSGTTTSGTTTSGTTSSAMPALQTVQEYMQGTKLYINTGQGWQEDKAAEQVINLASTLPTQNIDFLALRHITSTQGTNGTTTYQASLDSATLQKLLGPMLQTIASSQTSGLGASTATLAPVINSFLQHMTTNTTITVGTVNNQSVITNETVNLSMDLPASALSSASAQVTNYLKDIVINETITSAYTYNNTPITPPAGLPTTPTASSNSTTA